MPPLLTLPDRTCVHCDQPFNRRRQPNGCLESPDEFRQRRFCCHACFSAHNTGRNHHAFKPEGNVRKDGYVRVSVSGERKYLHRVIAEKTLNRPLDSTEHIHHKDENKGHNDYNNFEVHSNSSHRKLHASTQERNTHGQFA